MHPLIDVPTLAAELASEPQPALLDVRWRLAGPSGLEDYRAGHIPGAVFVDLDRDLAGEPGPAGRHPLPEAGWFQRAMRVRGVGADRSVVVYDQDNGIAAARAWWTLRYFGHERVQVLDGGYRAWCDAGCAITMNVPDEEEGDFVARPGGMPVLDADGARTLACTGVLLDVRAPERYRGEHEPIDPVAGHIPGAVNAPASANIDGAGRFLPRERLRANVPARAGGGDGRAKREGDADVGAYCGSGVAAAHEVLALRLAGISAALYVGSWSNWVADASRPIATGAE